MFSFTDSGTCGEAQGRVRVSPLNTSRTSVLLASLLISVLAPFSGHAACLDYNTYLATVGSADLPQQPYRVALESQYAYVADGGAGLAIVEISDPRAPDLVAIFELPGPAFDVALNGDLAVVAGGNEGLYVLDIEDPGDPALVGTLDFPMYVTSVEFADGLVVAITSGRIYLVSVVDPTLPTVLGEAIVTGSARDLAVEGPLAFIANRYPYGLVIVDISDPTLPTVIKDFWTHDLTTCLAVEGDLVYIGEEGDSPYHFPWFEVVDVSDPEHPASLDTIWLEQGPRQIAIYDGFAYVAEMGFFIDPYLPGVQIVDVRDPIRPLVVANTLLGWWSRGIAVDAQYAYVADQLHESIEVIDIRAVSLLLGAGDTPGTASDVAARGGWAFVADGDGGLAVFDASDPLSPSLEATVATPGAAEGVAVRNDLAAVAVGSEGLVIVNIEVPYDPVPLGHVDTPGTASKVRIDGDHAFVADGTRGLQIVRIAEPETPEIVGFVGQPEDAVDLVVDGDYAYVVGDDPGLAIIDVSNPASPTVIGVADPHGHYIGIAKFGDHVSLIDSDGTNWIYDVSDPSAPERVGYAGGFLYPNRSIGVLENILMVGGDHQVRIVDVTDPTAPRRRSSIEVTAPILSIAVDGGILYLAASGVGLVTVWGPCATIGVAEETFDPQLRPMLHVYPNPSYGSGRVSLDLPARAPVQVLLVDPSGRVVRKLVDAELPAGPHAFRWNARDDEGVRLPSGVYWAVMRRAGRSFSTPLVLIR